MLEELGCERRLRFRHVYFAHSKPILQAVVKGLFFSLMIRLLQVIMPLFHIVSENDDCLVNHKPFKIPTQFSDVLCLSTKANICMLMLTVDLFTTVSLVPGISS